MKILIVDDEPMSLEETKETVEKIRQGDEIICAENYMEALSAVESTGCDIALLDIDLPGMNGLTLAQTLKESNPRVNIIFITAYDEYALNAFSIHASGYLLKPISADAMANAFAHLRFPIDSSDKKVKVQCFGNFEVFCDGKPIHFSRTRAKELFAYLIDLNGKSANTEELCRILFEETGDPKKNSHYVRNLISDIRKTLRTYHAEDIFLSGRNQFSVNPDKIDCDYYRFLVRDPSVMNNYLGEYMKQYSWAEYSIKKLEEIQRNW